MKELIRILHVGGGSIVNRGVEQYLLNLNRYINHNIFSMDILTPQRCLFDEFRSEINIYGETIYELDIKSYSFQKYISFARKFSAFIKRRKYDIVEVNTGSIPILGIVSAILSKNRSSTVILHTHNTHENNYKNILQKIIFFPFMKKADYYFACSMKAGYDTFPRQVHKKITLIPNAINVHKYKFDMEKRKRIREKLGIDNQFVVGHVGAFAKQKNHYFLIEIFEKMCAITRDCVLLLVGDGELNDKIRQQVRVKKIEDRVIFYGTSNSVEEILCAMDVFCFPSKWEGLGIAVIEAQANGLPVLASSVLPEEAAITDRYKTYELSKAPEKWAKELMCMKREAESTEDNVKVAESIFNLSNSVQYLEQVYTESQRV